VQPAQLIFRQGPPGVQLWLLPLLADLSRPDVGEFQRRLRQIVYNLPAAKSILEHQQEDGSWPVSGKDRPEGAADQLRLLGLLENLHALYLLGGHKGWPGIEKGIRALLSYQFEDGRFPLLYHHQAAIGSLLLALGLRRNPAVHKTAHWILERQREDGGWLHPHMAAGKKNKTSCIWTSVEIMAFLARYQTFRIKPALQKAGEFILEHMLEANTTTLLPDSHSWNVLAVGSKDVQIFQGGTLKVLDSLSLAGFNPSNARFKKLYTWLLEQQLDNGLFPRVAGLDDKGDFGVTVRALEVIRRIETTRPEAAAAIKAEASL